MSFLFILKADEAENSFVMDGFTVSSYRIRSIHRKSIWLSGGYIRCGWLWRTGAFPRKAVHLPTVDINLSQIGGSPIVLTKEDNKEGSQS